MKKVKNKKKLINVNAIRTTLVMPICFCVIGIILYTCVSFSIDIMAKYEEKNALSQELIELKEEEQKLSVDVKKLQNREYVARYLREKFLYSKEGEYIIKIRDKEN